MNFLTVMMFFWVIIVLSFVSQANCDSSFDQNYRVTWGFDHVIFQGNDVQLSMDKTSGSRFESKLSYGSGFFQTRIKLPNKNSAGVVTAFYLVSSGNNNHDELDFEFLGNKENKAITLQTNVFVNGKGDKEQRLRLWFDPRLDFHTYKILWNHHHIVFYVDNIPIRVFKNNNRSLRIGYPSQPLKIVASLWNGEAWVTDGGKTKIDWTNAPFQTHFQGFNIDGCPIDSSAQSIHSCYSGKYWWNGGPFWNLKPTEKKAYQVVKHHYITYDYCTDKLRYPVTPPECSIN